MRETIALYPQYDQSPNGLEMLIRDLKKENGIQGTAEILEYSRSTVSYWLRKLSAFRNFAGQSADTILRILYWVSKEQSVEYAADLVAVSPTTLERSFERVDDLELHSPFVTA